MLRDEAHLPFRSLWYIMWVAKQSRSWIQQRVPHLPSRSPKGARSLSKMTGAEAIAL
jgi:hypothetical protein